MGEAVFRIPHPFHGSLLQGKKLLMRKDGNRPHSISIRF